jgi:hypothetical protein
LRDGAVDFGVDVGASGEQQARHTLERKRWANSHTNRFQGRCASSSLVRFQRMPLTIGHKDTLGQCNYLCRMIPFSCFTG